MAQRRDRIKSSAFQARSWIPVVLLFAVLLFVIPGIPASLTLAGGAGSVVLLAFIVDHRANGPGHGSGQS